MNRVIQLALVAIAGAALVATFAQAGQAPLAESSDVRQKTPPLIGGFFNGRSVAYLLTDVSTKKDAEGLSKATKFPVAFVPKLARVPDSALARLYLFTNGVKGPNPFGFQANVLDSVPGSAKYSPLWRVYAVTWKAGASPRQLKSEREILQAQKGGLLTIKKQALIKNSPVVP
jgi:hypothetical protein